MGDRPARVPLPADLIDGMESVAAGRHLPDQTLIRSWIGERLNAENAAARRPGGDR